MTFSWINEYVHQWVCRHRINLSGHESVVLVPRSRCWKCGEVLGRKYPIMTCLSPAIQASLSLFEVSVLDWSEIAQIAHEARQQPSASSLVNYCCFAPNTHDRQSQVVHRTRQLFCVRRNCVAKTNSSSHSVALADGYRRPGHISPFSTKSSWYQISTIKLFNLPIYLHIACLFEQFTAQRSNKSQSTIVTRSHATFTVCCVAFVWSFLLCLH